MARVSAGGTQYAEMMPRVVVVLGRHPRLWFTAQEVGQQLLGGQDTPTRTQAAVTLRTLRRMEEAGLVRSITGRRAVGSTKQFVTRWQITKGVSRFASVCSACRRRPATVRDRGWCRPCNDRWRRAGKPKAGPPKPSKGGRPRQPDTELRVQETRKLLAQGKGTMEIARTLGVPGSTVTYYKHRLAERGELPQAC
ncbi:hypothetical protein AB0392_34220 [Nonomuraea angiospora]|uniref:hypothetical protein n=1 Tax=Nonomuraea angiospora TaxID=46172 RepID=UPI00344DBF8C